MRDDRFSVWDFRKKRPYDKRMMQKLGAQAGAVGAGAADPAAIDFVPHQRNFEDTVKALRQGRAPAVDGREGRKAVEIILAIYRSALAGGKPVQLPLKRTPPRRPFR
jgi:predicted dehydrogenase